MELVKERNAGVYIQEKNLFTCSCGNQENSVWRMPRSCSGCGTTTIGSAESLNKKGKVRVDIELTAKEKDDRSFRVEKKELSVLVDDEMKAKFAVTKQMEMTFSLKDKVVKFYRNGKEVTSEEREDSFFRGISHNDVITVASTPNNDKLLKLALDKLGKLRDERTENLGRALRRLFDYPNLELFNFCGFADKLENIWDASSWRESRATKPNEILNVPKYMMTFLKKMKRLDNWDIDKLRGLDAKIGGNNVKTMFEILDDENDVNDMSRMAYLLVELIETFNYRNTSQLMTYLAREIKLQQGIAKPSEGAQLLRDYNRMCKEMKIDPEKYPKSLKKEHDIASLNYRVRQDAQKKEQFAKIIEQDDYKKKAFEKKDADYCVVLPTEPDDLVKEGDSLSHCVASYVDDVIKEKCQIVFVRSRERKEDSLLTLEIRGGRVVQLRGKQNRKATNKELEFVNEWAKKLELPVRL